MALCEVVPPAPATVVRTPESGHAVAWVLDASFVVQVITAQLVLV